MQLDPVLPWIARGALLLLFATSALHKLRDPEAFVATVRDYQIGPRRLAPLFAGSIIAAELGVLALLLSPLLAGLAATRGGAPSALTSVGCLSAAGLLGLYSGAIGINLLRGRRDVDCGCFGPAHDRPLSPALLARNAILVGLAFLPLAVSNGRPLHWVDALTILGGVAGAALLFVAVDSLVTSSPLAARVRRST